MSGLVDSFQLALAHSPYSTTHLADLSSSISRITVAVILAFSDSERNSANLILEILGFWFILQFLST
ncbi:hypothetical protein CCB80_10205 [Armatimonadetes bacterium Uphvl-Ar1]|nr:hypothetical protein CCB80_10205 [Armatimonadetes bacterium Uphvl-Ar1]